jgi:2-dehydropantoate 2-reductase
MKILIFGSGVIGCIYASGFFKSNQNVTLLARGKRYDDLRRNGVIIRDVLTGIQTTYNIPLVRELAVADHYDLIIVTVRLDQLHTVIPVLKENRGCPQIMFMLNNPGDIEHLTTILSPRHVIVGFPGAGGIRRNNFIDYIQIKQQKTTIGEVNGKNTGWIREVKGILQHADFEVKICANIQAWLKTHAVFISCIAAAILKENGDSEQLSKNRSSVKLMVRSIREGFSACIALGMPIEPANLKIIFMKMPRWFSILYWQHALKGKIGSLAIAPHANAAKGEMKLIAEKVITMVHASSILTPSLDELLKSFDSIHN